MRSDVVKIQVPLASNEVTPMALVYNQKRDFETFLGLSDDLLEVIGDRPKAYFKARFDDNNIELIEEVPNPGW